ncbi:uncharacterized protein LOC130642075 [Hydractinia symbiolongicarpus]|uniref:uncharacterized protein LOC130642075 n=1 Tax=Hydractinia symbiolongicarpus TaxID=13093 RepID=UPI002550399D|nr:uncharacterized protein LOC130642075 [Hydractinia symbiolongicarpus]
MAKIITMLLMFNCCVLCACFGRGSKLHDMWKNKKVPPGLVRVGRNPFNGMKCHIRNCQHLITARPPVAATRKTKPPTKSPEEIAAEIKRIKDQQNPKQIKEWKSNTGIRSISKEMIELRRKLGTKQLSCAANSDCTNQTCCLVNQDGIGVCVLKPHRIGDRCTDLCACANNFICKKMEANIKNISQYKRCAKVEKKLAPKGLDLNDFNKWKKSGGKGGEGGKGGKMKFTDSIKRIMKKSVESN